MIMCMLEISSQELSALSDALMTPDFIVVGEMHGSKQNAALIKSVLDIVLNTAKQSAVAFEWMLTNKELEQLRRYICGGEVPAQLPPFFLESDGRFTYEHAGLLKQIRAYNRIHNNSIDIYTFDTQAEDPDRAMAESLLSYKKNHTDTVVLVETGNMHARKSPYVSMGTEHMPMTAILKKNYSIFSMFLHYMRGEIDVGGVYRNVTEASSQNEDPKLYFDAVIEVSVSEASENPSSLTAIAQLL